MRHPSRTTGTYSALILAIVLILSQAPSPGALNPITSPSPTKLCSFTFQVNGQNIEGSNPKCRGKERRRFNGKIRDLQPENPQYRVDYSDDCRIGLEIVRGCDQNPDENSCEDGSAPYIRIIRFNTGPRSGDILTQDRFCPGDETPPGGIQPEQFVEVITVTPEQFRRFPIRASKINSDPKQFSLRNGHTHLWASAEEQTFTTDINGTSVRVRATPVRWAWNYGDGSTRNFETPGEERPDHSLHDATETSHSYSETGTFQVNLTTLYHGEFMVPGGSWQTIPGQAAVPSEAVPIDVWRTEKELIAGEGE